MYEIWLALNIVREIALGFWPLLAIGAIVWLVLMALAWRRPTAHWRSAWPMAAGVAVAAAMIGFLMAPPMTRSSLQELAYWVDWATLAGIPLAIGVAALAFAWPASVLRRPQNIERNY